MTDHQITASDGVRIHYQVSGAGSTALVFAHGWLGNAAWWDAQRDHLAGRYTVVQVDLPGHGASGRDRRDWSPRQFADDLRVVCEALDAPDLILVGHSMSGVFAVEAAPAIPRVRAVVLIDTLKDLEERLTPEQAAPFVELYRTDFRHAVLDVLPAYQFAATTPPAVRSRIQAEMLTHDPEMAIAVAAPIYTMDCREIARRVTVPVRAINADYQPTHREHNQRYFRDYDLVEIAGTGHFPMLERPDELNRLLDGVLAGLG
jgi:pimeloyl-ACP methyl ester carboxylesterase